MIKRVYIFLLLRRQEICVQLRNNCKPTIPVNYSDKRLYAACLICMISHTLIVAEVKGSIRNTMSLLSYPHMFCRKFPFRNHLQSIFTSTREVSNEWLLVNRYLEEFSSSFGRGRYRHIYTAKSNIIE